jgi:hypothetical protein
MTMANKPEEQETLDQEARLMLKDNARKTGAVVDPVDFAAREKELEAKRVKVPKSDKAT